MARLTRFIAIFSLSLVAAPSVHAQSAAQTDYHILKRITGVRVAAQSTAYPGGRHEAANLLDEDAKTEYSSDAAGTNTFVELKFPETEVAAFRHIDRNDPATIRQSLLTLLGSDGREVLALPLQHPNLRAGVLFTNFNPVKALKARWQVTQLGSQFSTVGGAAIELFAFGDAHSKPSALKVSAFPVQMLERSGGQPLQPITLTLDSPYLEKIDVLARIRGTPAQQTATLSFGLNKLTLLASAVEKPTPVTLDVSSGGELLTTLQLTLQPVRKLVVYILPHSHVDIGYTALQADVAKKQDENIRMGLKLARDTASYPEGSRFKWNMEVLWPVKNYLETASPAEKEEFMRAVTLGQVGLDAFFANVLTGLCRPEELLRLTSYASALSTATGLPIESAMISDVPGYTWSTVTAMAHAGVKYFSFAPNYFDRMGGTMKEWQNKPFWWVGPDRTNRVLCWCPSRGYALGHLIGDGKALANFMPDYVKELDASSYPYDISHLRWNVHGDNGAPDENIAQVVRDWNARYIYPRLVISTTAEAFRAFEKRYGAQLPVYAGDYTPYWEDGAGSSALETGMNRQSAERLVQAETLWVMQQRRNFPKEKFEEAWRNVLLYSEHTWGAHNSISQPDLPFVTDQWRVKRAFATDADKQSRELLSHALGLPESSISQTNATFDVFNTLSWKRSGLVTLSASQSKQGDRVTDSHNRPVPSQRLSTGELVFLAEDMPPFSRRAYTVSAGVAYAGKRQAVANGAELSSSDIKLLLNEQTGALRSFYSKSLGRELANPRSGVQLNDYVYVRGTNIANAGSSGVPMVRVKEAGPLVASLVAESAAPGAKSLAREIRLVEGLPFVEIINTLDKLPIREKEAVHFGFDFAVPNPEVRMDVGLAVVRPEIDQIPAACKNWFSVQRWVDVSNGKFGVTMVPVDAPLIEVGGITANLIGSQTDWRVWIQHISPSARLYSWAMNNHWHTNYRADQEGSTTFRYVISAHGEFDSAAAYRLGVESSQPLQVSTTSSSLPERPLLTINNQNVIATALKPSGNSWILRLYGAAGKTEDVKLQWGDRKLRRVFLSDLSEQPLSAVSGKVRVPAWGLVTLRIETK